MATPEKRLGGYLDAIAAVSGCSDEEAPAVQSIMYTHLAESHHVYALDGLKKRAFDKLARDCYTALKLILDEDGIDLPTAVERYFLV